MKPDTSSWRDNDSYGFFDDLPIEGLAWECLRRSEPYQQHYRALVTANAETAPCSPEAELLWGLRFPGQTGPIRLGARNFLVAFCKSCRAGADARTGFPGIDGFRAVQRSGQASRQSAGASRRR
ncbi:DUF6499 domain-containing protein [Mesorhizobium sp. VK22B]|uniref:DUF6499 domain-containing protein n=1 Tax=Mesorhizobium captivum TaxID=3072319 RepID=A0ABU4YZW8_9HYPH|nr:MULTISPECIES: DUF6499 domain-containing protein [unclassified Mesorhizobium]MDX8492522.1 DUF6499 domain-containing protein [Mesorhizobium sp. VK22B]MDX8505611.1 DUF6499 domain-containing protein [Mesorhizobium sp. VK22E]